MNKVIIMGNVGNAPSIKEFGSGSRSAIIDVGVHETYKDKDGQTVKTTEWFRCIAWNKTVDFIEKYVEKGAKCFIEGKMKSRTYKATDGTDVKVWEVLVDRFELLTWDKNQ